MVFAIPDWEDGNSKTNSIISEKSKEKQKNVSSKKTPQKTIIPKKVAKGKGVSEKSKLISKENKKQHIKQRQNLNNKKGNSNWAIEIIKPNNGLPVAITPETSKSKNKTVKKQKISIPKTKNVKKNIIDNSKVENIDTDKLDEVLLNAKKKKFNEALINDDVEAVLFKEDESPKKKKAKLKQKEKAKNNQDENSNKSSGLTRKDIKKNKLNVMLKAESNRNPINFNRNKLRERMLDRLKSAQFRFLNEKLYTSSGSEASQLFQNDPLAFQNYHEGYQQQLKKWPVNPLDVIVKRIKNMPKSHLIADMGCGEASLSKRVPHSVRSFDLVAATEGVETCDMAHTPLLTSSMDVVVYCLALMGTELTAYLLEANRVLKMGGHLLIAEVESRFSDVTAFTKDVARLGFKLQKLDKEREVFFFMEFVKNQDPPVKKSKLPVLTLKPCIYKRR